MILLLDEKGSAMLEDLYNVIINLCEVRGELDDETNAKIEEQIAIVQKQIDKLESSEA